MDKVNIIIPDTVDSTRYPGKNRILWKYTKEYLETCRMPSGCEVQVFVMHSPRTDYSCGSVWPDVRDTDGNSLVRTWCDEDGSCTTTRKCLERASKELDSGDSDINVLLQLTQPVRRPDLLSDAVDMVRDGRWAVLSYVEWQTGAWRDASAGTGTVDGDGITCLYDGAVYAWRGDRLFWLDDTPFSRHLVRLMNYTGPVCDIDYPWQYSDAYIRGLQDLASRNFEGRK